MNKSIYGAFEECKKLVDHGQKVIIAVDSHNIIIGSYAEGTSYMNAVTRIFSDSSRFTKYSHSKANVSRQAEQQSRKEQKEIDIFINDLEKVLDSMD